VPEVSLRLLGINEGLVEQSRGETHKAEVLWHVLLQTLSEDNQKSGAGILTGGAEMA